MLLFIKTPSTMAKFFKTIHRGVKHWYIPANNPGVINHFGEYTFQPFISTCLVLTTLFSISFHEAGILEIFLSIQNKESLDGWGWYPDGGSILSTLIGIILIIRPEVSTAMLPFYIGFSLMFRSFQGLGHSFWSQRIRSYQLGKSCPAERDRDYILSFCWLHILCLGLSLVFLTAFSFSRDRYGCNYSLV